MMVLFDSIYIYYVGINCIIFIGIMMVLIDYIYSYYVDTIWLYLYLLCWYYLIVFVLIMMILIALYYTYYILFNYYHVIRYIFVPIMLV